jgi:hypothetical protein
MATNPTNESRICQLEHQMLFAPQVYRKARRSASREGRGFGRAAGNHLDLYIEITRSKFVE